MGDIYNSKLARLLGRITRSPGNYAVTTSSDCTRYSCDASLVLPNVRWQKHENCHKQQYAREGWLRFVAKYLWYQMRYGYERNPFEVEARAAAEKP